ncbi:MAG: hypothetical protein WD601_08710, partial [Pseudohongiellaceae bacterium]
MRSIAIPVADRSECELALEVAFNLGKSLAADVVGYHMRPRPIDLQDVPIDMASLWGAGGLSPMAWPGDEDKAIVRKAEQARKLFTSAAGRHDYDIANRLGTLN